MANHDLNDLRMTDLLERLGSSEPTPGGGSAAALAGALGASMVQMLARLTTGRDDGDRNEQLMEAIANQAAESRAHLMTLAAKDAEAYDAVTAATRLPKNTKEEQTARATAVEEALRGATEVPLRIMEECLQVISIAKNVLEIGNRNALSDGATGAVLARAGLTAASFVARANLASLQTEEYVLVTRTRLDEMIYMGTKVCTALDSYVQDVWAQS